MSVVEEDTARGIFEEELDVMYPITAQKTQKDP